ncbi:MAG: diguanylate cyclase [Acidobacteriota bacterium]
MSKRTSATQERATAHGVTILVVDDDADTVGTISDWLTRQDYRVVSASSGKEALSTAHDRRPDLVLLDAGLPDLDGITVASRMRADRRTALTPIIFVTGRKDTKHKVACFEAGADDYVTKPFDFVEVETRLRAVLKKKELRDELQRANRALRRANRSLKKLLITDEKTKLHNYRYFQERIAEEFRRAVRYESALSCIMLDLDHFKDINDTLGHRIGDQVLEEFGRILTDSAREIDLVARFGGEEFIVILPHTDGPRAFTVAERIRRNTVSRTFVSSEAPLKISVSCGVATYPANADIKSEEDLVRAADEALYVAKNDGRNRTVIDAKSDATMASRGRPGKRAAAK